MKKNILIIGGSTGIGKSIIKQLGNHVHTNIINMSRTQPSPFNNLTHYRVDILQNDLPNLNHVNQLDSIIYCPGSITLKPLKRLNIDTFRKDFEINVLGAIKVIQAYEHLLKKAFTPAVLFFSTVATKLGMSFHSSIATSKSALEGLTKSLAAEYASKIRFNAIAPTLTDTPLAQDLLNSEKKKEVMANRHPLKQYLKPSEVASLAHYLISEQAQSISGQIFYMDYGIVSLK